MALTTAVSLVCHLYEPNGTYLTAGICAVEEVPGAGATLVVLPERPGRVVQRCLLDQLCTLWVHLPGGALLRTSVERVFFDPIRGRTCLLRVAETVTVEQPRPAVQHPAPRPANWPQAIGEDAPPPSPASMPGATPQGVIG